MYGGIKMIEVKNIKKSYGSNHVLKDVSFSISPGELIGIVGANGSGKTTLLSIMCGLNRADDGTILADGKIISNSLRKLSQYISYVPQDNPLISELSAFDNLRLWFDGSKKSLREKLKTGVFKELGIDGFQNTIVSRMSGGMKKRLSIGIALLENPDLLILDEPSAALDLYGKYRIREYTKYYTSQINGSVLIVSHDYSELSICGRLYLLKDGILQSIDTGLSEYDLIKLLK